MTSMHSFGQDLKKYKWQNRLIVVETNDSELWEKQKSVFDKDEKACKERKLLVIRMRNSNIDSFSVKLIGLDGGVKFESQELVSKDKVFAMIDAMPMRRNELSTH